MKRFCYLVLCALCNLFPAGAQQTEVQYLSGTDAKHTVTWDFWCSEGMNSGKWSSIEVPSCWEQQGFGGYTYGRYYIYKERESEKQYDAYREHDFHDEYGIYRHNFRVPKTWKDKQVRIVFEGVMTDAEVKVNGEPAGPVHQGSFYRFSYDITDLLRFGAKNQLEVTVKKQSDDKSVNAAERRADWWLFGGIYRPVYLEAKLKGTNRHCFDPETGRSVSRELDLKDARLIKQMNMNAVRSHYPPDKHFLQLCDSLGLLYVYELAGWQNSYSDSIAARLLPEMIARDVNHPCIFLWGNGNEGGWNTTVDDRFADYDPQQRHVIHPWANFNGLDTRHYPNGEDNVYRMERGQNVFMMTEFVHGLYDRGQGAGLEGLWAKFRTSPLFAGGFTWAYVDEALHRTDTGQMDTYGPNAPDGIVSADRQPEGSFYTVREVWSPIQITPMRVTGSFDGAFRVTNEYLFSRLDEACMKWRVWKTPLSPEVPVCLAEGDVQLPAIAPGETGTARFTLPEGFRQADMLELEAYNAAGDTVCTWTYPIRNAHAYFEAYQRTVSTMPVHYQLDEDSVMLEAGEVRATFSRTDGMLLSLTRNGQLIPLSRGPLPVGMKAEVSSSAVRMQGDTAVFTVKYTGGTDSIVWRMTPSGLLGMDALILNRRGAFYDKDVYNLGFTFSYPERAVKGMQWLGHGPYRVWKNRIRGTRHGIWQKAYNNTVTGEYYIPIVYPEFKGYHAGIYWATLQNPDGLSLHIYSETDGLFLHIFTPEEQRDRESRGLSVKQYPAGDLSFLLDIPAVNSQGLGGNSSTVKVNKGDEGFRIKLWLGFR